MNVAYLKCTTERRFRLDDDRCHSRTGGVSACATGGPRSQDRSDGSKRTRLKLSDIEARCGLAWQCLAWSGPARRGMAWQGEAWISRPGQEWLGLARFGSARLGGVG